ncbi:copper amine oxidase N-terminal domain-containing protein [Paenibacillus hunanensis]|uniref:copper amine oxidase N-terminal domain-containing protein n=1 Tax=Paenibacillus hunanensis TaxID=539262 RepID=UPI00202751E0|nr:copper amine oxidase N-terminal domain-containing protein [Paenibacillus hunanensis]MCL9661845.1 copper amine oxidase N-terminal domain-containing protein [Paenibacillus hunanensis]
MSNKIHNKQTNKNNVYDIQGGEKKVMKKSTKKVINVAASAALLAGIAPVAGVLAPTAAHASGSFDVINVPTLSSSTSGTAVDLGRVNINIDKYTLNNTATDATYLTVTLPSGFEFAANAFNGGATQLITADGGSPAQPFTATASRINSTSASIRITGANQTDDISLGLILNGIVSTGPSSGDVNVTFTADPNSGLPTGNVKVATVVSSGQVALEARDVQSSSSNFNFNLRVTESVANSLKSGNAIKLKLPSGFEWSAAGAVTPLYGTLSSNNVSATVNGDTLTIASNGVSRSAASSFDLALNFTVTDEDKAKDGDITATVSGNSSINVSSLVVGTYGQYGGGVTVASPTTVVAGQDEQKIGNVVVKEAVAGSFIGGRTVTLQLPEGARWQSVYTSGENTTGTTGSIETSNGLRTPDEIKYTGTDGRTLRLTWNGTGAVNTSNKAGSITLKDVEVAVQPGFTGDLNATVAGSQGLTGTVKLATAVSGVSLTATNATYNIAIGTDNASIGDLMIKEGAAGALTDDGSGLVEVLLPAGVTFGSTPTVSVTGGDLRIRNVSVDTYNNSGTQGVLRFYVDSESTTASTITVSGVNLRIDRTVPQGDIVAKVQGDGAAYTAYHGFGDVADVWNSSYKYAAKAAIATIGTAPAGETDNAVTAIYTIGSTAYTVNGQTRTAEVAPYVENGRTYLPVRYVAEALGVSQANILFDKATSVVTMIKGDRVVQLKLNTNQLTINGSTINMDVKAVTKANRTVLPIAWVGKALDAVIQYDAAAKTVTVNSK